MIDQTIIGKLKNLLIVETQQEGEIKTLFLPKGVILELKISSDYEHRVTEEALVEIEDYINEKGLEINQVYYPN